MRRGEGEDGKFLTAVYFREKFNPIHTTNQLTMALFRSPIVVGAEYQAHSKGPTLSCEGYKIIKRLDERPTDRDPITIHRFIHLITPESLLEASQDPDRRKDRASLQQWMDEIGVTAESLDALACSGWQTVCIPYLVGDCFGQRCNEPCPHGHPPLRMHPISHPLVYQGGECIQLREKGAVHVSRIAGFSREPCSMDLRENGHDALVLSDERFVSYRPCAWGSGCRSKSKCKYYHGSGGGRGRGPTTVTAFTSSLSTTGGGGDGGSAPLCRFFQQGKCKFGDRCRDRHL